MIKKLLIILVVFLLVDHFWIHYGGAFVEKLKGDYSEGLERRPIETENVQIKQIYKKSILDQLWEKIKNFGKSEEEEGG
ncbi:MAG: hypothetical protein NZ526_00475 [Aquificaceae bacterium]|nr:hypothetical protein [Aquificaceae bacterium]